MVRTTMFGLLMLACALGVRPVLAQAERKPADQGIPGFGDMTVDMIMDQAVRNIARRYNLNEAQTQKTSELMKREVNKFLREHHDQIWPVLRAFFEAQKDGKLPDDAKQIKQIGKAATPLLAEVRKAIFDGNEIWREILSDDQKKTHDVDMTEMGRTFTQMDDNIKQWAQGKPNASSIFPATNPEVYRIRKARKPPEGIPIVEAISPDFFQTQVEEFIRVNQLVKGQADTARSILNEFKENARDYLASKKDEIAKVRLSKERARVALDLDAHRKAADAEHALLKPIQDMFPALEARLVKQLTSSQLERYNARKTASTEPTGSAGRATPAESKEAKPPIKRRVSKDAAKGAKSEPAGDADNG